MAFEYFSIMEMEPGFTINEALLKQRYYENARKYHPDLSVGTIDSEQTDDLAALNNKAFKALSAFTGRVSYILEQSGLAGEEQKKAIDPEFLARVMELNEQLADLQMDADESTSLMLASEILMLENEIMQDLHEKALAWHNAVDAEKPRILSKMAETWAKYKYLLRLQEGLATFAPRN